MPLDTTNLEPKIYRILSAPGTDLSTISAKRVRRQLLETDASLTAEYVKEHRAEFDILISKVYERVSAESGANNKGDEEQEEEEEEEELQRESNSADEQQSHSSRKRQHEGDHGAGERVSPPAKKAKKGVKVSDEELARQLSNEINGRERKTRTGGKVAKAKVTKGRPKKSAETIDSDGDSAEEATPKKKAKKRASTAAGPGAAKGGFAKEFVLSEPLAAVVQAEKMSRPQVVKQLWVYIKDRDLQNPSNRKEIVCDPSLRAVFGKDKIDMFAMNKVLGQHLHEP